MQTRENREKLQELQELIASSDNIVFFGGAGVSTESGIPDFRSVEGLYSQQYKYPPETILSHSFFVSHTDEFYGFYRNKLKFSGVRPNKAHFALAELEKRGKLKAVVTQNIDGLHQMAGSETVLELHGSVYRNHCMRCGHSYDYAYVMNAAGVPSCHCGGVIKPDVVLYEETLDSGVMSGAASYIGGADMLIVGGTSLGVYPAAGLLHYYRGERLVLINKSSTPMDHLADLVINAQIGRVLGALRL